MRLNSYIIVTTDSSGKILSTIENNASIEQETLEGAVSSALSKRVKYGETEQYGLMFLKNELRGQTEIVFADNRTIYSSLWNTVGISIALFAASLVVIFLISLALSGIAVNPVKSAWKKQKQFVADASHELNTPLTVIIANNNIMMAHKTSTVEEEMKWLQSNEEEARHMKKLIEQMLFLAKSDSQSSKPEMLQVNISEIIEATVLNFEPVAFEKGITIDCCTQKDIVIMGSPTLLTQLTHILLDNAVKYSEANKTVSVNLKKIKEHIYFSVNNKGNVIAADDLNHIFDRFYRAEKSRTSKGHGLGLAIAHSIVTTLGGKISVTSSEQEGTTFTVKL